MTTLKLISGYGIVTVLSSKNGLEYHIPNGMYGKDFAGFKILHKHVLQAFKYGYILV